MKQAEHNFEHEVLKLLRWLGVDQPKHNVHVLHDIGCAFLKGGYCDCEPEVRYIRLPDSQRPGH